MTPDGWAYWEGSISLLQGLGYRYFGGQPITDFPPLFSIFLAAWQAGFGVSGRTLSYALLSLIVASSVVWTAVFSKLLSSGQDQLQRLLLVLFFPSFFAAHFRSLLSEALALLLLGLLLLIIVTDQVSKPTGRRAEWWLVSSLGIVSLLLLLCRNSALVFLPGVALFVIYRARPLNAERVLMALAAVSGPVAAWHFIRVWLGQVGSTALRSGTTSSEFSRHTLDAFEGLSRLLGPDEWYLGELLLFLVLVAVSRGAAPTRRLPKGEHPRLHAVRAVTVLAGTAVVALVALFGVAQVHDPLSGRFLWFMPLILVGAVTALSALEVRRRLKLALLGLASIAVCIQMYRAGSLLDAAIRGATNSRLLAKHTISPEFLDGPPRAVGDQILIAPPSYSWIDRSGGLDGRKPLTPPIPEPEGWEVGPIEPDSSPPEPPPPRSP